MKKKYESPTLSRVRPVQGAGASVSPPPRPPELPGPESFEGVAVAPAGNPLPRSSVGRRQGIFWLLTVPARSRVLLGMSHGTMPSGVVWCRGQLERGEDSGFMHYQVVVAFAKKLSLRGVKEVFGQECHAELSRSEAANEYVCKLSTRVEEPFEFGAKPIRVNSKIDYESVWTAAKAGDVEAIPARVRVVSYRTIRAIASDYSSPQGMERTCFVYWGPTATGKSHTAWANAGDGAYSKNPRTKFWDGYHGQECAVIDEFRGSIDISYLLTWTDRYPVSVEIKGSNVAFCVKRLYITSNLEPYYWYPELDAATRDALLRRLTIVEMNTPYVLSPN